MVIDNEPHAHKSSLMRIISQQPRTTPADRRDEVKIKPAPKIKPVVRDERPADTGGQLYKIRRAFEAGDQRDRKTSSTLELPDFPCQPGNVANLRVQLSPTLIRSTSNISNSSEVSVNSILSKAQTPRSSKCMEPPVEAARNATKKRIYENSSLRLPKPRTSKPPVPPKPTGLYPSIRIVRTDENNYETLNNNAKYQNVKCDENDSVFSENSAEYESISGESRMCESMQDLNVYENIDEDVTLPFIEPVGETSDGVYEDLDLPTSQGGKCLETCIDGVDDDDDEFGFEFVCHVADDTQLPVNEVINRSVPSVPESKKNKYKRKLKERVDELIQSEINYIDRLKFVVENYIPEIEDENKLREIHVTADFTKENIFLNIEDILNFHSQVILPNFKRHKRNLKHITDIFFKKEQLSSLYTEYAANYKRANQILFENNHFFKEKQSNLNQKINLAGYLLEPIQRLPRYNLFLEELLKSYKLYAEGKREDSAYYSERNSPTNDKNYEHENYENNSKLDEENKIIKGFHDATSTVKHVLNRIDDILTISNIKNCLVCLTDQGDLLLHDEFKVHQSSKKYHMRCFLFEKMMILAIIDKTQPKEENYVYHDSIPMTQLGITPPEHAGSDRFEIWFLKRDFKSYYLESSVKVCDHWIKKISSLLWEEAETKKKMLLNREGERWINSLKPIKRNNKDSARSEPSNESLEGSSTSWARPTEKYSSLRGVRGEISQGRRGDKKRTTWYVEESTDT